MAAKISVKKPVKKPVVSKKPKPLTEEEYLKQHKQLSEEWTKHAHVYLPMRQRLEQESRKNVSFKAWIDDPEKHMKKHKEYPKLMKHLKAMQDNDKKRKELDDAWGKVEQASKKTKAGQMSLSHKMQLLAGEKPSSNLNREFHKNMMRHHRREGNHHLDVENKLTAMAEKHRNKVGAYKPEGEAYKKEAEFHAGRVQHHANKYQMHKKAMKAIPEGRKKGSK